MTISTTFTIASWDRAKAMLRERLTIFIQKNL